MLNSILIAVINFFIVYGVIRLVEYGYHRIRRTTDWSPHWGSWAFSLLVGLYVLVTDLGRS